MKKIIILFAFAPIFLLNACSNSAASSETTESPATAKPVKASLNEGAALPAPDTTAVVKNGIQYQCPMHKEVISDKPGKCPKCGMKLVQKKKSS